MRHWRIGYAAAWTYERFQPLLAPVIAELAADMIEYRARARLPRRQGIELYHRRRYLRTIPRRSISLGRTYRSS